MKRTLIVAVFTVDQGEDGTRWTPQDIALALGEQFDDEGNARAVVWTASDFVVDAAEGGGLSDVLENAALASLTEEEMSACVEGRNQTTDFIVWQGPAAARGEG